MTRAIKTSCLLQIIFCLPFTWPRLLSCLSRSPGLAGLGGWGSQGGARETAIRREIHDPAQEARMTYHDMFITILYIYIYDTVLFVLIEY